MRALLRRILSADTEEARFHETFNTVVASGGFLQDLSGVMLDVGARDGLFTEQLLLALERAARNPARVRGAWRPIVVDVNPAYLAAARQRFPAIAADVEHMDWPFADRSVTVVTLNQILEHIKDPFRVLGEADRVLKVGGYLLVGVPNLAGWVNRLYLLIGKQPPAIHFPGPHVRGFALPAFRRFLETNPNFVLEKFFGSCAYPLPPRLSEWWAKRHPIDASFMFFILRKAADNQPSAWLAPRTATGETVLD